MDGRPNRENKASSSLCERDLRFVFLSFGYSVQYTDHSLEKESRLSRYSSEPAHVTKYDVI